MTMWLAIAAAITGAMTDQLPAPTDVTAAVRSEFATRDLNGDGILSRAEFGAWLAELRAKGANTKADAPETRIWVTAAFARADRDRSAGVTEAELTDLLTLPQVVAAN